MKVKLLRSSPLLSNAASTLVEHNFTSHIVGTSNTTQPRATSGVGGASKLLSHHPAVSVRRGSVCVSDENHSDPESGAGGEMFVDDKESQYRKAIKLINDKCEALTADNDKLVLRLHHTKKITKRKERDVALLKSRLDLYSDEWRTAQPESQFKGEMPSLIPATNNVVVRKKYKKREKPPAVPMPEQISADGPPDAQHLANGDEQPQHIKLEAEPMLFGIPATMVPSGEPAKPATTTTTKAKKEKQKRAKSEKEKDPNAPKRPANPFFQFCQERRTILMGELNSELMPGEPELSKQELTRQLANRWRSLDAAAKQVYINMYEISKQKYNDEMESYRESRNAPKAGTAASSAFYSSSCI